MGYCDYITVSVGYRIKLRNIIDNLNDATFRFAMWILRTGVIEDENDDKNKEMHKMEDIEDLPELLEFFESNSDLLDEYILVPSNELISTIRGGISRLEERHAVSAPLMDLNAVPDESADYAIFGEVQRVLMIDHTQS